jgi:hypothetical protein
MVCAQEYLSLYFFNFTSFTKEALWNEKSVWASSGSPNENYYFNEAILSTIIKQHFKKSGTKTFHKVKVANMRISSQRGNP